MFHYANGKTYEGSSPWKIPLVNTDIVIEVGQTYYIPLMGKTFLSGKAKPPVISPIQSRQNELKGTFPQNLIRCLIWLLPIYCNFYLRVLIKPHNFNKFGLCYLLERIKSFAMLMCRIYITQLKQFKQWRVPAVFGSFVVFGALIWCVQLHSRYDLKSAQMNGKRIPIQKLMPYMLELGFNAAKLTKTISHWKYGSADDHSAENRWFMKFRAG